MDNKRAGFTIMELLLTIAILGFLITVTVYSVNLGRQKSRDGQRLADLNQLVKALEFHLNETGHYPPSSCGYDCEGWSVSYDAGQWNALAAALDPFIDKLPVDPINSACNPWVDGCFSYAYGNVGDTTNDRTYDLTAQLETSGHPDSCGKKGYRWNFDNREWCGPYSDQIFEASPK